MAFREISRDTPLDGQARFRELPPGTLLDGEEAPRGFGGELIEGTKRLGQGIIGLAEAAGSVGTGLIGSAAGGVVGLRRILSGTPEEATAEIGKVSEALTYKPQTEAGNQFTAGVQYGMGLVAKLGGLAGESVQDLAAKSQYTKPIAPHLATATDVAVQSIPYAVTGGLVKPGTVRLTPGRTMPKMEKTPGLYMKELPPVPPAEIGAGPKLLPAAEPARLGPARTPELVARPKPKGLLPEAEPRTFLSAKEGTVEVKWNSKTKRYEAERAPEIETVKAPEAPPSPIPPASEKVAPGAKLEEVSRAIVPHEVNLDPETPMAKGISILDPAKPPETTDRPIVAAKMKDGQIFYNPNSDINSHHALVTDGLNAFEIADLGWIYKGEYYEENRANLIKLDQATKPEAPQTYTELPKEAKVEPKVKEPWEMTEPEWDKQVLADRHFTPAPGSHEAYVREAIEKGKPVPPEVLKDYPDLAPKPPTESGKAEANKEYVVRTFPKGKAGKMTEGQLFPGKLVQPSLAKPKPKPSTLIEWVRQQGGINDPSLPGETSQFTPKETGVVGLVNKKTGKPFDELTRDAIDAKIIPEGTDSNAFKDLLQKDVNAARFKETRVGLGEAGFVEIPVEELRRAANRLKEFWVPMSTLPHREKILGQRYKALGDVARVERIVDTTWKKLKGLPEEAKRDIFKVMSGQLDPYDVSPENAHIARHLLNVNDLLGEMLVKRDIIKPEQFEAHKGQYIRYMYLKHILGDDAKIPTRPNGKLDLSYQKSRKDLTWEQRRALGIIEDVSIAEPLGMAKALSDVAKYDYLEKLADDPRNVWKPSIVEIPDIPKEFTERGAKAQATRLSRLTGQLHQPVFMGPGRFIVWNQGTMTAIPRKMGIGQLAEEIKIYERMAHESPSSMEIQGKLKTLQAVMDKAKEGTQNVPEDFVQMPESKHWGPMAGAFVRKPIARDLMGFWGEEKGNIPGLAGAIEKMARLDQTATGIFKTFKAPLNIPTAARNTVSNFIQMGMSGMSPLDIPIYAVKAVSQMIQKTPEYGQAFRHGLFKTNWSVTELGEVMDTFRRMQGDTWGGMVGKVQDLAKYYGRIDDVFKFTKYLEQREAGATVEKAVIEAQKWGMDYSLADPSVKWARRHLIPFASYPYKIAPLLVESAIKRPWVIGSLAALPYAMWEAAKSINTDMTENDWKELRKSIPVDLKERGTWMLVPVKVGGKYRWFDYSYMLPWGNYIAGAQAMREGNIKGVVGQFGVGGTPALTLAKTFAVDPIRNEPPQDPFSNQPIYNKLDPAYLKAGKTMEFFYSMMAPSMMTRYGALGYTFSIGKEDRWGRTVDTEQALGRWFGVNLQEAAPKLAGIALKAEVNALKDELIKIMADPQISPERKEGYRKRFQEAIRELQQKREK